MSSTAVEHLWHLSCKSQSFFTCHVHNNIIIESDFVVCTNSFACLFSFFFLSFLSLFYIIPPPSLPSSPSFSCSDSDKNYLFQLDIVGDITAILDIFRFDPGVISEVFGVIACLSTLSVFVDTIGCVGVHRQVCFYLPHQLSNFWFFFAFCTKFCFLTVKFSLTTKSPTVLSIFTCYSVALLYTLYSSCATGTACTL